MIGNMLIEKDTFCRKFIQVKGSDPFIAVGTKPTNLNAIDNENDCFHREIIIE